ncbi:hypothetical protein [Kitasatospora sp. NPDC002965]|uniref:hypothetical protein n=1 Tax=Kitasatospora sp. NPDC002965 TaxID=3154775 RepID=UPI0033ADF54E
MTGRLAAGWSQRIVDHHGGVTEVTTERPVETGRSVEDTDVASLEVRGRIPEERPRSVSPQP